MQSTLPTFALDAHKPQGDHELGDRTLPYAQTLWFSEASPR